MKQLETTCSRVICLAVCIFGVGWSVRAAGPSLSVSFVSPASVQVSWPSNYTAVSWQLMGTTTLIPADWKVVSKSPVLVGDALTVLIPLTDSSGYFRLQEFTVGGGGCVFQAAPAVIQGGNSSTLTWCPQAGTTYSLSPGPGIVTGGNVAVSPTVTTVYTLTASNASGAITNYFATVIVNPCGWLQVKSWDVALAFSYNLNRSTADYSFSINQSADIHFHLTRQAGSTATDAHYFGFATRGTGVIDDREDDKSGPQVFTTTEVGSGSVALNVSFFSLHVTCNSYDFSFNVVMNTTETSQFGVTTSFDGIGTGAIASLPLPTEIAKFSDHDEGVTEVPAQYPPSGTQYFVPSSDLGKAAFTTGVVTGSTAGNANVAWDIIPVP